MLRHAAWVGLMLVGCAAAAPPATDRVEPPRRIEGTSITDTPAHRTIVALVEKYRRSMLDSDPDQMLRIVSPRYLDDSGTPDPSDDVDHEALERSLRNDLPLVHVHRLDLDEVQIVSEASPIVVRIRYTAVSELDGRVVTHSDETELVVERRGNELLVVSGL